MFMESTEMTAPQQANDQVAADCPVPLPLPILLRIPRVAAEAMARPAIPQLTRSHRLPDPPLWKKAMPSRLRRSTFRRGAAWVLAGLTLAGLTGVGMGWFSWPPQPRLDPLPAWAEESEPPPEAGPAEAPATDQEPAEAPDTETAPAAPAVQPEPAHLDPDIVPLDEGGSP
jgi:hypothetical protein